MKAYINTKSFYARNEYRTQYIVRWREEDQDNMNERIFDSKNRAEIFKNRLNRDFELMAKPIGNKV